MTPARPLTRTRAALALLALLAGGHPSPAAAAPRPAYGGELHLALPLPPRTGDPALAAQLQDTVLARALHATPLTLDAAGRLAPGLLLEVPAPQSGGRSFRLTLREGLRFADGTPLGALDLAASLARLLRPEVRSPHAWVALPIAGAEAVLAGRAASLAGLVVLSDRELLVSLDFPFPEFPAALATLPAAVVSPGGAGAGPFRPVGPDRAVASEHHWRGRPFADALTLAAADPRAAERGLTSGALDLSLRPEPSPGASPLPLLGAAYALVNGRRLGPGAAAVRRVLTQLDRAELARRFVRAPAEPLEVLLPPAAWAGAWPGPGGQPPSDGAPGTAGGAPGPAQRAAGAAPAPSAAGAPPLSLLVPGWLADPRSAAERLQVKLSDAGLRVALEPLDQARYAARLAAGDYDVALLVVPLLTTQPALAAGQVALAVAGPRAARRAEQALAGLAPPAAARAAEALRAELDLVPLYAAAAGRVAAAPRLQGLAVRADGGFDAGDLWRGPEVAR
ncbi:MAG: ABC transporter substrate-binding protein [Anaeromyxobacter sp.]|nr:ABC transporter substrate-binding protein [Anaeromyxobacter sp.]